MSFVGVQVPFFFVECGCKNEYKGELLCTDNTTTITQHIWVRITKVILIKDKV